MKRIFLFCTKPYMFFTELPPLILLIIAIVMNGNTVTINGEPETMYFYPLIIFLILLIIFIAIFFYRALTISKDEIRMRGLFSSRDKIFLKKDQTLVIGLLPHYKLRLEVWAGLGEGDIYDWMKNEKSENHEISYFRERAVGGDHEVKKIMKFFGIDEENAKGALNEADFFLENENVILKTAERNEIFEVSITFKKTLV